MPTPALLPEARMKRLTENYHRAVNAQDLTSRPGEDGPLEALGAVAWSRNRTGAALMRLHSEWDGIARRGGQIDAALPVLKSLQAVKEALATWAPETVAAVLTWWLYPTCRTCSGTKWQTRQGMSRRSCPACHGRGEAPIPGGEDGKRLLGHMEDCIHRGRASTRARLRP